MRNSTRIAATVASAGLIAAAMAAPASAPPASKKGKSIVEIASTTQLRFYHGRRLGPLTRQG